jgi:FkbM family methyltransferase
MTSANFDRVLRLTFVTVRCSTVETHLLSLTLANNGVSARWFAQQFPKAAVAAIEPDAGNCELLRENTLQQPNVTLFRAAIGGSTGEATLKGAGGPAWAIQTEREGTGERVPIVTVTEIAAWFGDHYRLLIVKVDIEGFEADLFSRNLEWLDDLPGLIIEPHDRLFPGEFTSLPLQRAMADRRFEMLIHGENLVYIQTA